MGETERGRCVDPLTTPPVRGSSGPWFDVQTAECPGPNQMLSARLLRSGVVHRAVRPTKRRNR